jgi:hypothetical protein
MSFSKAKRVFFAAVSFFLATLLLMACEGPDAGQPQTAKQGGNRPPDVGSGMVVRCQVCKGVGSYFSSITNTRRECENCNGTGRVRHTK